jgi:hypothetical protein
VLRFQFEPPGRHSHPAGGREFQPGLLSGEIERVLVTVQKSAYVRVRVWPRMFELPHAPGVGQRGPRPRENLLGGIDDRQRVHTPYGTRRSVPYGKCAFAPPIS